MFKWPEIVALVRSKPRGMTRADDRQVMNGILWVVRSGSP
jgi:transposase